MIVAVSSLEETTTSRIQVLDRALSQRGTNIPTLPGWSTSHSRDTDSGNDTAFWAKGTFPAASARGVAAGFLG